jgi:hypothetical protein
MVPPLRSVASALVSFWTRGQPTERTAYMVGALLLISGLIHVAILLIGGGSWQGPLSLRKAMTFGLSFGLTLITIVWVASFLRLNDRERVLLLGALTVTCALETALVTLQAWRGCRLTSTWKRRLTRRSRACWPAAASSLPSSLC